MTLGPLGVSILGISCLSRPGRSWRKQRRTRLCGVAVTLGSPGAWGCFLLGKPDGQFYGWLMMINVNDHDFPHVGESVMMLDIWLLNEFIWPWFCIKMMNKGHDLGVYRVFYFWRDLLLTALRAWGILEISRFYPRFRRGKRGLRVMGPSPQKSHVPIACSGHGSVPVFQITLSLDHSDRNFP